MSGPELSLLQAVNAVRVSHGLPRLRVAGALQRAARSNTARMLRTGAFTHGDFAGRMARFHIRGPAGENLAWGSGSYAEAGSIVAMWMNSAPHRANLLRAGFHRVGIGAGAGPFGGEPQALVVTADFAR